MFMLIKHLASLILLVYTNTSSENEYLKYKIQ